MSLLQTITLLCASKPGSGAGAAAVAAVSRLAAAGVWHARQATVTVAFYCGCQLDERATLSACQVLLAASGALRDLELTVNPALAPHLHE
jgi:hypothetical protein